MNTSAAPYRVPPEPGRLRALALALLMHLLLLGFLWIGVSWQNVTPVAVEAEIWSPTARTAAPPPPEPEPTPEPVKPAPAPAPPPPPAETVKARTPDPDIALEKERQRKAQEKKLADEKARREAELERKREAEAQEKEKKKLAELEKKKLADDQKRKQEEAAAEEKRRQAEEQQRRQEEQLAEQRRKKQREEDLKRLHAQAGDGGTGDAERSAGPKVSASYAQKIGKMIKDATIMPPLTEVSGNAPVEYAIELLPDGSVREVRLLRSCGIPAFDQAVRRAIDRAAPYPPDPATGKVPASLVVSHRPKDH